LTQKRFERHREEETGELKGKERKTLHTAFRLPLREILFGGERKTARRKEEADADKKGDPV